MIVWKHAETLNRIFKVMKRERRWLCCFSSDVAIRLISSSQRASISWEAILLGRQRPETARAQRISTLGRISPSKWHSQSSGKSRNAVQIAPCCSLVPSFSIQMHRDKNVGEIGLWWGLGFRQSSPLMQVATCLHCVVRASAAPTHTVGLPDTGGSNMFCYSER